MPISLDRSRIKVRSRLILEEGQRRGFDVVAADYPQQTFRVTRSGMGLTFQKLPGVLSFNRKHGYGAYESKTQKKHLLEEAGLRVPQTFALVDRAEKAAQEDLQFPAVVKPQVGSLSANVSIVRDHTQLLEAAQSIEATGERVLVEEYIEGRSFRLVVVGGRLIGAVQRRPASVVGNGSSTVTELVTARNAEASRGGANDPSTTNHHLVVDETSRELLTKQGLALDSVPPAGVRCYLQVAITAATGADYVDWTDEVHPTVREDCERFARTIDLLVVGMDYIAADIGRPDGSYNEFNLRPYIDLNENNNEGLARPVSAAVWDYVERHSERLLTTDMAEF